MDNSVPMWQKIAQTSNKINPEKQAKQSREKKKTRLYLLGYHQSQCQCFDCNQYIFGCTSFPNVY